MKSANAEIFTGFCRDNPDIQIILKKIDKHSDRSRLPSEIIFHQKAAEISKDVVKILEFFELRKSFVLILEKPANSLDLLEFVNNFGPMDEHFAQKIVTKIAHASLELLKHGICHRDIKDENVLFNPQTFEKNHPPVIFGSELRRTIIY